MFTQISSRDFNENKINECRIVAAPVAGLKDFPFCSDLIILDEQNMLGIEFNVRKYFIFWFGKITDWTDKSGS